MKKPVLAAQLFTIRQFTQTAQSFAESMQKICNIGYKAVQISGIGAIDPAEVKRIIDNNGLAICITHVPFDQLWHRTQEVIDLHRLWDCKHVAIGSMPGEFRTGEDGFHKFAHEASQVGEKLARAGLTFSYHNHSFEFARFGHKSGLEIIFEDSDPRYLQSELDTYWVQHGGGNPSEWVRRLKNRMPVIHLKDMAVVADGWDVQQIMAEIGEGNLNWKDILEACQESGVEWYAVEQDVCQRDPFESLEISYKYLKSMGLE